MHFSDDFQNLQHSCSFFCQWALKNLQKAIKKLCHCHKMCATINFFIWVTQLWNIWAFPEASCEIANRFFLLLFCELFFTTFLAAKERHFCESQMISVRFWLDSHKGVTVLQNCESPGHCCISHHVRSNLGWKLLTCLAPFKWSLNVLFSFCGSFHHLFGTIDECAVDGHLQECCPSWFFGFLCVVWCKGSFWEKCNNLYPKFNLIQSGIQLLTIVL